MELSGSVANGKPSSVGQRKEKVDEGKKTYS